MGKTNIGWTDYTFNPWIGCTKVSAGCVNCYAERDNKHRQWNPAGWGKGIPRHRTSEANWDKPYQCDSLAKRNGVRFKVFCASLADVFDPEVPLEWLADLLKVIDSCQNLDWLLLTKRIDEVERRINNAINTSSTNFFHSNPNVWLGTTAENKKQADIRIPQLLKIPARIKFVSAEPLLEPLDDFGEHFVFEGLDWVIVGGESGGNARPMEPGWVTPLKNGCNNRGIPFFMKQMSGSSKADREAIPEDLRSQEFPT